MRVPDVPAYLAMPRACGANTAPIAFAEVYLALQNGTVEAQENPLTTIEAKKFYEVQKNIVLTGHIVDHLNTLFSKKLWTSLSDEDKKIFGEVAQEAAERATKKIETARRNWSPSSSRRALRSRKSTSPTSKRTWSRRSSWKTSATRSPTGTPFAPSSKRGADLAPRLPDFHNFIERSRRGRCHSVACGGRPA